MQGLYRNLTKKVNQKWRKNQKQVGYNGGTMKNEPQQPKILAVAPMMSWTDTHCRHLHRLFSPHALLFTEMAPADAIVHGPKVRLLQHHPDERPLACQLGGSRPKQLALAAAEAAAGFAEVNLNVGCPSPRAGKGGFGAALMAAPKLVAQCVHAMQAACGLPVTVKCRLGIDGLDTDDHLTSFIDTVAAAGCRTFYIHARKAVLNGLTPAQNRSIPPLQPQRAYALKAHFPTLTFVINGGITDLATAGEHLRRMDGLMIGRAAWHDPSFLNELDILMFGGQPMDQWDAATAYLDYARQQLAAGTPLADLAKPMLGLFKGWPGARHYRRALSSPRTLHGTNLTALRDEVAAMQPRAEAA